jgi:ParB-like chromosome segregation protein Spo0J
MIILPITKIKENPDNPRIITKADFEKLKRQIKGFPKMMRVKPLILDPDGVILGGNQRFRACKALGWKEIPTETVSWTEIEKQQFIIQDNTHAGVWDYDILANTHDAKNLIEWGVDVPVLNEKAEIEEQEIEFSEYLDESNNYIVLTFDNDIDWLSAQTHFNLKSVYSKRQNGKPWSKGIGRVINGADYLDDIKDD